MNSALIVDDSEADRYLLRRMLKKGEIAASIEEARDGQDALRLLENRPEPDRPVPELILLDINMPGMSGFDFLQRFAELRRDNDYQSTVVLMVTSSQLESERKRALAYDFVRGFLVKMPSGPDELREFVESVLASDEA